MYLSDLSEVFNPSADDATQLALEIDGNFYSIDTASSEVHETADELTPRIILQLGDKLDEPDQIHT